MATLNTRLAILTEIIAPYRIPVFNALARLSGIDLHVIFLAETDEGLRQWQVYKDEIGFSYQILRSWRWRVGRNNFLFNYGLRPALQRAKPQAILCGGYNYLASWEAQRWARRRGAGFVLWSESNRHDARGGHNWREFLKAYFVRRCDRFVVPGKSASEYLKTLGAAAENIFIAPNAVDNHLFASGAEKTKAHAAEFRDRLKLPARYILFVGRLVQEKGVFDLLEAYAGLESALRAEVGLVFAGDGDAREMVVERARSKDIAPGTVFFPGFAQREDLAGMYGLAEMLVLATHSDPWGLVVNEAMACGLPVIVSSVAGCTSDLVEEGWNGYVVPPRDPEKLSEAMTSLLRQPELRRAMSIHSWERIRSYSPEACAEGLAAAGIAARAGGR